MAASRIVGAKRSAPKKAAGRRNAASGGPAARSRRKPGNPGFSGYDVIVTGALADVVPDYDRAIERFARSEAEALYEAQEHAVNADAADRIIEEPGEQYFNAREGLKTLVRLRRVPDGVAWINSHRHQRLLICALGELIAQSHRAPPIAELKFLLEHLDNSVWGQAWWAVQRH